MMMSRQSCSGAVAVSAVILILSLGSLISCSTSPLGRKQLTLMPDSQMASMGAQSFEDMKKQTPIDTDAKDNAYVKCIAEPLIRVANAQMGDQVPGGNWEIVVFQDKTPNAFALPGGKIGVHTGMFPVAKSDAQLAAVIGHEIGHVIAKHGNERVSENLEAQGGLMAIGALTQNSGMLGQLLGIGAQAGAQLGFLLPHSRTQESEADLIGLDLMSQAGFDPHQSVELWKNMSAAGGGAPPEFMSTHPSDSRRIQALTDNIPAVLPKYQAAQVSGSRPHCAR